MTELLPKKLNGSSFENIERFKNKLNYVAKFVGWGDVEKATFVPLWLEGKLFDFYESLSQETKENFEQTMEVLIDHYRPNISRVAKWVEFTRKKMKRSQKVTDFYDELNSEARKMGNLSEDQIKLTFISGLSPDLAYKVAAEQPGDLAETLKKARHLESLSDIEIERESDKICFQEMTDKKKDKILEKRLEVLEKENLEMKKQIECENMIEEPFPLVGVLSEKPEKSCDPWGRRGHLRNRCKDFKVKGRGDKAKIESPKHNLAAKFDTDMMIKGKIGDQPTNILLDSGSEITICGREFWDAMSPRPNLEKSKFSNIIGVGGQVTRVHGSIKQILRIGDFSQLLEFHVIDTSYEAILGRDFLAKFVIGMSWPERELEFRMDSCGGDTLERNVGTTDEKFNGKLVRSVYLKPGTARKVWVYPKENILARNIELSGDESLRGMQGYALKQLTQTAHKAGFRAK